MSTYTNWYHLDKYEGQDKPNLLDQYNAAMDKIDSAMHQIAESGGGGVLPPDLESRLEDLESDVTNLKTSDTEQNTDITNIKSNEQTLNNTITAQNTRITTIENTVSNQNQRITSVESNVSSQNARIDGIRTDLNNSIIPVFNPYNGKNILFIGDSYTYGTGASDHLSGDTKRFSSILANTLNMIEFNYGVGGTGFAYPGNTEGIDNSFTKQAEKARAEMTTEQRRETYLVIIAGGINDVTHGNYTYSNMGTGVASVLTQVNQGFPNAKILVVPMMWKGYDFTSKARNLYNAIVNHVQHSTRKNVNVIEGAYTWHWGDSSRYTSDKLHPNDSGHSSIAYHILHGIFGDLDQWDDMTYTLTFDTNFSNGTKEGSANTDPVAYVTIQRGIVYLPSLIINNDVVITSNTQIGTIPKCCTPEHNVYMQLNRSNSIGGEGAITVTGNVYANPHLIPDGITPNGQFYLSPICYPLYGKSYN